MPQSRLVGALLSPALKVWLRSQVEGIDSLSLDIKGSDRQILTGYIPGVDLAAAKAIYQGLHFSSLEIQASTIRINVGQVIRGKALQLLEPIEVSATVMLSQEELEQSVSAPLLANALVDVWQTLAATAPTLAAIGAIAPDPNPSIQLGQGYLELSLKLVIKATSTSGPEIFFQSPNPTQRVTLRTSLDVVDGHSLQFHQSQLLIHQPQFLPPSNKSALRQNQNQTLEAEVADMNIGELDGFQIDLGTDVIIQSLVIAPDGLQCRGHIWVRP